MPSKCPTNFLFAYSEFRLLLFVAIFIVVLLCLRDDCCVPSWCNPCKMLSPILEKLTADEAVKTGSGKSLDLVTIDTDAEVELAQQFQVSPYVNLFHRTQ